MEDKNNIGATASILGISSELLRHYERKGIIIPCRDENGYRYFDRDTVQKLIGLRRSRAFGFSLEDSDQLLKRIPVAETLSLYEKRLAELEAAHQWQEMVKDALRDLVEAIKHISEEGICRVVETDPFLFYHFQHNHEFFGITPAYLRWQEKMPVVMISPSFPLSAIRAGSDDVDFNLGVPLKKAVALGLDKTAGAFSVGGGTCITTVISSEGANHIRASQMTNALSYAETRGYACAEDAWGITIHNLEGKKYHRIYLPVTVL